MSQDLGLEGIPVAVRLRLKPSAEIIKGARLSDDAQLCIGHIQTQTKPATGPVLRGKAVLHVHCS